MGLVQWIIIIVLVAIIIFGFAAVYDFGKGVIRNVYPHSTFVADSLEEIINSGGVTEPYILSEVTRVIDGDTIEIEGGERIRFAIVNTPERGQAGWQEAKDWTEYRCLGNDVLVDLDDKQSKTYNRLVGVVYCEDPLTEKAHFINLELLDLQLAVSMPRYCEYSEFKDGILCQYPTE
jgi:endonuclease YncB( thermonuclease family)